MRFVLATVVALALVAGAQARPSDYAGVTHIGFASAYCESSGNIHAIGWHGIYRGKWQFDQATWNAFAPRWLQGRDPAWVPEYWQDYVAQRVPYDAWPRC